MSRLKPCANTRSGSVALPAAPAVKIAVRLRLIPLAPRGSPDVLPGHALADRGHNLVADRAQMPGELLGGDALGPLGAEQHDLLARRDLGVAAVHEQLVHRHGPGDPVPPASYERLGAAAERARIAVPVPDRHGRDGRIALERVSPAVGEPLA